MAKRQAKAARYHDLDEDPSCEHVVDQAVRVHVGRRDLDRAMVRTTTAIVKALGANRRLWFRFEAAADELRALREATYFDVGVEYGIASTRATAMAGERKTVSALAQRVVRELMRTGVARDEVVGALLVAAWALMGGEVSAKRPAR
jgi:hypothetical protein